MDEPRREALVVIADPRMQDGTALAEIELYSEVLIAAAATDGPLSPEQIDAALGLRRAAPAAGRCAGEPDPA